MFGWGPPHDWPAGTHQASAASPSSRASARFSAIPGRADRGTTRVHPATSPATKANKPIGTVRKDKAHWLHQRAGEAGKNWYVGIMGFNTAILIADSVLTDDTVKTLNLVPVGGGGRSPPRLFCSLHLTPVPAWSGRVDRRSFLTAASRLRPPQTRADSAYRAQSTSPPPFQVSTSANSPW